MTAQSHTIGIAKNLTANAFTRPYYTFAGWATTSAGVVAYADAASYTSTAQATLYAKWTPITYTVTYDENGGNALTNDTYTVESATFNLQTPTRTGYSFSSWK